MRQLLKYLEKQEVPDQILTEFKPQIQLLIGVTARFFHNFSWSMQSKAHFRFTKATHK